MNSEDATAFGFGVIIACITIGVIGVWTTIRIIRWVLG